MFTVYCTIIVFRLAAEWPQHEMYYLFDIVKYKHLQLLQYFLYHIVTRKENKTRINSIFKKMHQYTDEI